MNYSASNISASNCTYYLLREEYANCLNRNPGFFADVLRAIQPGFVLPPGRGARAANESEWLLRDIFQYLMAVQEAGACPNKLRTWKYDRGITPELLNTLRASFEAALPPTPATAEAWAHRWALTLAGLEHSKP